MRIAIVPAYNEEKTISRVVHKLRKIADHVVVVNDYSTDDTDNIARKSGALVIQNAGNKGYENAIYNGINFFSHPDKVVVFTFDADDQHNIKDALKMIRIIENDEADIVVGVRPKFARFSEKIFSNYTMKKIGVYDPLCGLKCYKAECFNSIKYYDKRGTIFTNILFNAKVCGYRIKNIPVTINKRKDKSRWGGSIRSNIKILSALFRVMLK